MHTKFQILNAIFGPLLALTFSSIMGCGEETPGSTLPQVEVITEQAKLRPSDGVVANLFGRAVAISDNTALVGASSDSNEQGDYVGAAYVFERNGETWTQQTKILPSNSGGASFGYTVALEGNVAIVYGGAGLYVFERSGDVWAEQQMLVPPDLAVAYGSTLAIAGDRMLVGAYADSNQAEAAGAAYMYVRINGVWTLEQQLLANDGGPFRNFGCSVALTNDTALVGATSFGQMPQMPGAAYVFVRQGQTWTQQAKLSVDATVPSDMFGERVALSGNTALISAAYEDDDRPDIGAAYVFVRNGGAWTLEQKIIPGANAGGGNFYLGRSITLEGDTALLSANDGQVHRFQRSGSQWTEGKPLAQSLANYEPQSTNLFGDSISFSKNTALVGAPTPQGIGSAYVFVLP